MAAVRRASTLGSSLAAVPSSPTEGGSSLPPTQQIRHERAQRRASVLPGAMLLTEAAANLPASVPFPLPPGCGAHPLQLVAHELTIRFLQRDPDLVRAHIATATAYLRADDPADRLAALVVLARGASILPIALAPPNAIQANGGARTSGAAKGNVHASRRDTGPGLHRSMFNQHIAEADNETAGGDALRSLVSLLTDTAVGDENDLSRALAIKVLSRLLPAIERAFAVWLPRTYRCILVEAVHVLQSTCADLDNQEVGEPLARAAAGYSTSNDRVSPIQLQYTIVEALGPVFNRLWHLLLDPALAQDGPERRHPWAPLTEHSHTEDLARIMHRLNGLLLDLIQVHHARHAMARNAEGESSVLTQESAELLAAVIHLLHTALREGPTDAQRTSMGTFFSAIANLDRAIVGNRDALNHPPPQPLADELSLFWAAWCPVSDSTDALMLLHDTRHRWTGLLSFGVGVNGIQFDDEPTEKMLRLRNRSSEPVVFRLQTWPLHAFRVFPSYGIVDPGASVPIRAVYVQPEDGGPHTLHGLLKLRDEHGALVEW
jgi:hypothetical protein